MKKIFVSAVLSLCMALLGGCGATGTKETSSTSEDKPLVVQFVPTNNDGSMEAKQQKCQLKVHQQTHLKEK